MSRRQHLSSKAFVAHVVDVSLWKSKVEQLMEAFGRGMQPVERIQVLEGSVLW